MSSTTLVGPVLDRPDEDVPRRLTGKRAPADRAFRGTVRAAAVWVLVLMAVIGGFLLLKAWPALHQAGWSFFTTKEWQPEVGHFGIPAVLLGTVLIALVALVIAVPFSFGAAIYICEYAPVRARRLMVSVVDVMAAIPSIVYGLWGFFFLQPRMIPLSLWLSQHFGWIPIFKVDDAQTASRLSSSTFITGTVVSLMVIPIVCSLMREVFSQAPIGEREAAVALGGSRWAMIRTVVIPFGRGGMIGAVMLGLGRALGETVAVYLIISQIFTYQFRILQSGGNSIAALIATRFYDSTGFGVAALMAAGVTLFIVTLIVNTAAASIVARSRSGALTEI